MSMRKICAKVNERFESVLLVGFIDFVDCENVRLPDLIHTQTPTQTGMFAHNMSEEPW